MRREDAGVFHCSAANPAGVASANLTLEVVEVLREEEEEEEEKDNDDFLLDLVFNNDTRDKADKLEEKQSRKAEEEENEEEEEDSMIKVGKKSGVLKLEQSRKVLVTKDASVSFLVVLFNLLL